MKQTILIVALHLLLASSAVAQFQKGTFLLEDTFGFSYKEKDATFQQIIETPANVSLSSEHRIESRYINTFKLAYGINNKTAIGIYFDYSRFRARDRAFRDLDVDASTGVTVATIQVPFDYRIINAAFGVYASRFIEITNNLYLVPSLSLAHRSTTNKWIEQNQYSDIGYWGLEDNPYGVITGSQIVRDPITGDPIITTAEEETNSTSTPPSKIVSNFLTIELSSTLLYQINKRWGLQATFFSSGLSFNYQHSNPSYSNPKTNIASHIAIAPSTWKFGLVVFL